MEAGNRDMKRVVKSRDYEEVLQIIEKAFQLKETNLSRYRKMIQDILSTGGIDADSIVNFFKDHSSVYECEKVYDYMDTACRDKVVNYSIKWANNRIR